MSAAKPLPSPRGFEPDERQRQAIEHVSGPMLVVAGAGTGKTTVLIKRIAHLIRQAGVRPDEILAVTYTDNAAREMRERVAVELRGTDITGLQTKTFHAYCNEMLGRYNKQFRLVEDADLWIFLRRRIRELNLQYFTRAANVGQFLSDLLNFMRRCQDELVGPERYGEYVRRVGCGELAMPRVSKSKDVDNLTEEEVIGRCKEIASVFATVEGMLRQNNLGTFGQMITGAYDLLQSDSKILATEQQHSRHILVDEFQDANFAQIKIIQKLAADERNVFAVGDPDQAIYRFRGASSAAFELFRHHFESAKLVVLEKNRRSTTPILRSAYAIISKNAEGVLSAKPREIPYQRTPLISAREEEARNCGGLLDGVLVDVVVSDKDLECSDIVTAIKEKKKRLRCSWRNFAVLYRQHAHRDKIAQELADEGIPFTIENMDVTDTPQVRDLLACAGGVVSLKDSCSLFRVAALPQFDVDPEKLRAGIRAIPKDMPEASVVSVLEQSESGKAVLEGLEQAREEIERRGVKAGGALEILIGAFGLDRKSRPMQAALEFVEKWESKPVAESGLLGEFLDYLEDFRVAGGSIAMPSEEVDTVKLITAHGVKGLEFDHVFVLRVISNSFPSGFKEALFEFPQALRDPDSVGKGDDKGLHEEEERRLFYVAMTRARDSLTLYGQPGRGKKDPTPPGYLRELLQNKTLVGLLRQRPALGFQTDMFASAEEPFATSRTSQWLSMVPASDLSARLSASAVASYEQCPLQFKLEREWRFPTEPPAPLQYGASMHRVLRTYYDSIRFDRPMGDEAVIELFRADLAAAGLQDAYQFELYEKQGIEQLKELLELSRQAVKPKVLHTEEWFEIKLEHTTVAGRIDRIDEISDGRVAITDYKTGKPQNQDDADKSLQLSIYALAAREKWGYRADRIAFYNLSENSAVPTERNDAQLEDAKLKVNKVATKIAAGNFEAKPGFHCSWCAYRNLCPATEKRLYNLSSAKKSN